MRVQALAFIAPAAARPAPKISAAEAERRVLLAKAYSRFMMAEDKRRMGALVQIARARDHALQTLADLDPQLHKQALVIDEAMYPPQLKVATDTPAKH